LISHALDSAGIHPESISYVEGHGTGTQLGDSIEIAALSHAFQRRTPKKQFCPIGSVKPNIGHSESAAGIASLTKVLLQMEHGQLAPSIYSDEPNPNVEFEESPFYLQHGLAEWPTPPDQPRRALINSFGAGGVNACVIIDQYEAPKGSADRPESGPCVFALSARSEERLREYADRLLAHLRKQQRIDLASLCYTLQVGREAMEERLAIVVSDVDQLIDRIGDWSRRGSSATVHRGSLDPRRGSKRASKVARTTSGAESLNELASRWVAGEEVDWESLYPHKKPSRVTLPTYPFARERYWVSDALVPEMRTLSTTPLHPLIAYNSSTLSEVSFSSSLSETAFYAVDHRLYDERIFPGAAFLEMACIAGNVVNEQRVRKITDVVWMQPVSFRTGAQALRTVLRHVGDTVQYEISSFDDERETIVHAEGRLVFGNGRTDPADGDDRIQLEAVKAQCTRAEDGPVCYGKFREHGLQYGPSFQTIEELYVNGSSALSKLKLADHLKRDFGEFILHPSMIDGALQTIAGVVGSMSPSTPYLPFALDEMEIIRPVPATCYAYAECTDAQPQNLTGVMKFDIRLLNESGDVLIKFRNLYVRPLAGPLTSSQAAVSVA
jgi:acyl transferase domain-containing protein